MGRGSRWIRGGGEEGSFPPGLIISVNHPDLRKAIDIRPLRSPPYRWPRPPLPLDVPIKLSCLSFGIAAIIKNFRQGYRRSLGFFNYIVTLSVTMIHFHPFVWVYTQMYILSVTIRGTKCTYYKTCELSIACVLKIKQACHIISKHTHWNSIYKTVAFNACQCKPCMTMDLYCNSI